jgi:carbamoyl-phosphate synthase small subunit
MGMKYNIARILKQLGCRVTVIPITLPAEEILAMNPDGILLSPGPGDPAIIGYATATIKKLLGKKPILGICLGHQLIAHAYGASTYKLKFGHRGGNHPVRELATGRIHITTQNHGYAVNAKSLKGGLEVSHINSNDGTVEGLCHKELPIICIQYHSEGAPGPEDNIYIFHRFLNMVRQSK